MMAAAIMGATSFVKGLGAMHALSHAIGALVGAQHGLTNAVLMPDVLRFNRPAIEAPVAALAGFLGLEPSFDAYYDAKSSALSIRVGIPPRITDIGVARQDFERLAASWRSPISTPAATRGRSMFRRWFRSSRRRREWPTGRQTLLCSALPPVVEGATCFSRSLNCSRSASALRAPTRWGRWWRRGVFSRWPERHRCPMPGG